MACLVVNALAAPYEGRRVLVTGHTGFKGAWLALWLAELGARVTGYALPPDTDPSLFELAKVGDRVNHRAGDVRDPEHLASVVEESEAEFVFHLAAQAIVRTSYEAPIDTFSTNVLGTAHLLEAIREAGRPVAVVVVTSDKVYARTATPRAHVESDPLGGNDPYSASKGATELVAAAYRKSFFESGPEIRIATARAGNVIGGGDWSPHRIVPDCISALLAGEEITVRNPHAVRPWQHVLEPLSGYLWLGTRLRSPDGAGVAEAWNFGPSDESTIEVAELVDRVVAAWGEGSWRSAPEPDAVPESPHLALNSGKSRQQLGWRPVWPVSTAIAETVDWYRAWAEGARDLDAWCARQIARYSESAQHGGLAWACGDEAAR